MAKKDEIMGMLAYNEDKKIVTLSLNSDEPITEENFIAYLYDFVKEYGQGFSFEDVGECVPFDMDDLDAMCGDEPLH